MRYFRRLAVTTAAVAVTLSGIFAAAGTASASTPGCTEGVYAGYCGTQGDAETSALVFDVYRQAAKPGNKIIGYANSDSDPATDFYTFAYQGGSEKIFEYAPNGIASNLCISEPASHSGLVLRVCNGSRWQQFEATAVATGFTWTDKATGDLVEAAGARVQLAGVSVTATLNATLEWTDQG
jgi:hypothetical protein